uniref:Transposable element P transposase-like RNase H domain-containing protein n=1 Tax=Glossina austeni TaxID=7395 RepID=A0A1A9V388_GLOAU
MKYPKLWGVNGHWIDWDLAAKQLAANLTEQLGYSITTKDVRLKQVRQETVPDVEALRALVSGLDPLDKVVTLAFDELFTNQETTYLAAEDRLYGCGYDNNGRAAPFATVLIFWVRSIFTQFNMLLSTHNFVQNCGGAQDLLEDRINLVEMIGLDLKAVICDRSGTNRISLRGFRNDIYMKRKKGECPYKVRRIFDYAHLVDTHYQKIRKDPIYDIHLICKLKEQRKESSNFWVRRGAVPSVVKSTNFTDNFAFFSKATSAYLRAAIKAQRVRNQTARRTCHYIEAVTKLANVFHRNELNVSNWQENKETLRSAQEFFQQEFEMQLIGLETVATITQFSALINELLQTYPNVPIKGYRASQDFIEIFVCNMAPNYRKRTRSAWDVEQLSRRLIRMHGDLYRNRTIDDDYQLTELLDYRVKKPAKEALPPFGLHGEGFEDIQEIQTPQQAEEYLRLLTGYGVGQVIRDELRCQQCLSDFVIPTEQAANEDNEVESSEYLNPMFLKAEVQDQFREVYQLIYQIFKQNMPENNLGMEMMTSIRDRVPFFQQNGTCTNGIDHRRHLLSYIIRLALSGEN